MIYLCRGHERAVCETEELALAREAQGYRRCSAEAHRVLWTIANIEDQARLRGEEEWPSTAGVVATTPPGFRKYIIRWE